MAQAVPLLTGERSPYLAGKTEAPSNEAESPSLWSDDSVDAHRRGSRLPRHEAGHHLSKGEPGQRPDHKPNREHVGQKAEEFFNTCDALVHGGTISKGM